MEKFPIKIWEILTQVWDKLDLLNLFWKNPENLRQVPREHPLAWIWINNFWFPVVCSQYVTLLLEGIIKSWADKKEILLLPISIFSTKQIPCKACVRFLDHVYFFYRYNFWHLSAELRENEKAKIQSSIFLFQEIEMKYPI